MKFLSIILIALALSGCANNPVKPEPVIVVKQEYIVRIPPAEAFQFPPAVPDINVDADDLTQGDVARWLALQEERMKQLESKIREIAKFLKDEQNKLDATVK